MSSVPRQKRMPLTQSHLNRSHINMINYFNKNKGLQYEMKNNWKQRILSTPVYYNMQSDNLFLDTIRSYQRYKK